MSKILDYGSPLLKKDGYFIAYKSRKTEEEIITAQKALDKNGLEIVDIIKYTLPLEEVYERNLVCIKKL